MNKIMSAICIIVILSMTTIGCGKSESVNTSTIMSLLEETNKCCDEVTDFVLISWEIVGPEKILSCLDLMLNVTSIDDMKQKQKLIGYGSDWFYVSDIAEKMGFKVNTHTNRHIALDDIEPFYAICKNYQDNCSKISENMKKLEAEIKIIKNENKEAYNIIKDYYLKTQAYVDIVLAPSGNLMDYSNNVKEFQQNIKDLKQELDL